MNKQETAAILKTIKTAFPQFEITVPLTKIWYECLISIEYSAAQLNLRECLITSKFPPTIAEVARKEPDVNVNHHQMLLDTQTYLEQREEHQRLAIDCPPHLRQTYLKSGESNA